jgi:glutamyl-tRNA reductase
MNHDSAPIELRERMEESMQKLAQSVRGDLLNGASRKQHRAYGSAVLSTCNRLELYTDVEPPLPTTRSHLLRAISDLSGSPPSELEPHLYFHTDWDAIDHLHRVACGLESQVLGESEILGQVADAFVAATEQGALTPSLVAAFQSAIRTGRRARHETGIGRNPASVGSVAVALAREASGAIEERHIVVIGAGVMGRRAVLALHAQGARHVSVVSRSLSHAQEVASELGYDAFGIGSIAFLLADADVMISATAAPHAILDEGAVRQAMAARPTRELVLVDIAVPRDIDARVRRVAGVHLFDVDDLRQGLDESLAARRQEAPAVEELIRQELAALADAYRMSAVTPLIVELRASAEEIREQEYARTRRYLKDLDEETLAHVEHLSRALVNRLLHEPTVHLKQQAGTAQAATYASIVRDLFGLSDEPFDPEEPSQRME